MSTTLNLSGTCRIEALRSAIVVFNFADGEEGRLADIVSSHPGLPVIFLSTTFNRSVFSQAEGRNRVFVFSTANIDRSTVDPTYPGQWLDPGDMLPGLPGGLAVYATPDGGFRLTD